MNSEYLAKQSTVVKLSVFIRCWTVSWNHSIYVFLIQEYDSEEDEDDERHMKKKKKRGVVSDYFLEEAEVDDDEGEDDEDEEVWLMFS